ncbi:hypothetical protein OROGR_011962 [Orobanche gracilis]
MSVVGFDFGNESCVVAVARQRGIDVVLNDEFKSEIPAIVCFGDKRRFLGTAGAATSMMNPENTISQVKRLIGRQFSDPELQHDLKSLPFLLTEDPSGFPLIHAQYLCDTKTFTPTQVLGMMFSNLKSIAEKNLNATVVDCCIGIHVYFTDLQRRAVLDAATIAGLHPLRLFHETTATALAYGFYKTDLPENEALNVAFVDVGHSSLQVCIAAFKKGELKVLAHSFDRSLGGRDFDEALFQHFATKFKDDEYKINVYQNARACLKLRAACQNLKKVLSANPQASLNIECLMEEKDVRVSITREEFENISIQILERVKKPLEKALSESGLTIKDVHLVEVVGSGSRVPAIIKILTEFFRKEPSRIMNASECVSKGCALQCAILSPTFTLREFQVNESFPFPIALTWKCAASDAQNGGADNQQSIVVFPKGDVIPSVKEVRFPKSRTSTVDLRYADVSESQASAKISSYTIGPILSSRRAKLKLEVRLNLHGIVSVESATVEALDRMVEKINVRVSEVAYGRFAAADFQKAVKKELEMALQDRVMDEIKDKKNAVEAYVYDMRNKLSDKYHEFVMDTERDQFMSMLQEVLDWLYDDGEYETEGVYVAKLEELKKLGDPIEERYKEHSGRGSVIDQLVYCISIYREAATSSDLKNDHIDRDERQKVLNECVETEAWLREKKQH